MLDLGLHFKGEKGKLKIAHNGSSFDIYQLLNNLPRCRTVVDIIKNGSGIVSLKILNGYVDENKRNPQIVHLRCGRVHNYSSLKRIGINYKLQSSLLKQERDQDEIYEDTWEDEEHEWLLYFKNDVLSAAFSYARYSKGLEEMTGFGMKNIITLLSFAKYSFNSMRDEKEEPIYTYTDDYMRYFVRKSINDVRCSTSNQYQKPINSNEVCNVMSTESGVNVKVCETLDKCLNI